MGTKNSKKYDSTIVGTNKLFVDKSQIQIFKDKKITVLFICDGEKKASRIGKSLFLTSINLKNL